MNKTELINHLAEKNGLDRGVVEKILNTLEETIIGKMLAGEEVVLTGFGAFSARQRAGRIGVNPRNPQEKIQVPSLITPKFKAGKKLKDILRGKVAPEKAVSNEMPSVPVSEPIQPAAPVETPSEPQMQ